MRGDLGKLHTKSTFRNGDRRAGIGVSHDDYSDESLGGWVDKPAGKVRLPHDGDKPEDLNGECIIVQAGKKKEAVHG